MYENVDTDKAFATILLLLEHDTYKTQLNKLLFFADFAYATKSEERKQENKTITRFRYYKHLYGPVPKEVGGLVNRLKSAGLIRSRDRMNRWGETHTTYKTNRDKLSLETIDKYLDDEKKEIISLVIKQLSNYATSFLSELSHQMRPWSVKSYGDELLPKDADNIYDYVKKGNFPS